MISQKKDGPSSVPVAHSLFSVLSPISCRQDKPHLHFRPFEEEHLRGGALLLLIPVVGQDGDGLDMQGEES